MGMCKLNNKKQEYPDYFKIQSFAVFSFGRGTFFVGKEWLEMLERKPVLCLKAERNGNRGIFLYDEDLFLMKQLLIHQSMRSPSIHDLLQSLSDTPRNSNGITNRLGRLCAAGIFVQMKEKVLVDGGNLHTYHYRLGSRGVDALVAMDLLNVEEGARIYQMNNRLSVPTRHTKAASSIANQVFLHCYPKFDLSTFSHERGASHTLFSNTRNEMHRNLIVPDWVFEDGNRFVCLELDTGTQRKDPISSKFKRYFKRSEQLLEEGKELIVIFSVADDSVMVDFSDNRKRRIASLKEMIPPFTEWPKNLAFYVVTANRTPSLVERLLSYDEPFSPYERFQYADDWKRKAIHVLRDAFDLVTLDKDKLFSPRRRLEVDCDLMVSFQPKRGGRGKSFAVIYGEEGSVITHQLIRANAKRVATLNESENQPHSSILVCYDVEDSMIEDVYGQAVPCDMWQTDSASWVKAMNLEEPPSMKVVVSPLKKEWRRLDE